MPELPVYIQAVRASNLSQDRNSMQRAASTTEAAESQNQSLMFLTESWRNVNGIFTGSQADQESKAKSSGSENISVYSTAVSALTQPACGAMSTTMDEENSQPLPTSRLSNNSR